MVCTLYALKDKTELPKEAEGEKGPVFTDCHWALKTCKLFGTITACLCSTEQFDVVSFLRTRYPSSCCLWSVFLRGS